MVYHERQTAKGKDAVYRRPQNGAYGRPQTPRLHRRGHSEAVGHVRGVPERDAGRSERLLRGGDDSGHRQAGLHPDAGAVRGD